MGTKIRKSDIAVIGMAARFPRADNIEEYWQNLRDGIDCISSVPQARWESDRFFSSAGEQKNRTYCNSGGFINDAYDFDPLFFNISPKETVYLDPQQRKVLEVAYETFEHAGYGENHISDSDTGVFLGLMGRGFFDKHLWENRSLEAHHFTSSLLGFTANRISFHFNLKGPSLVVDTLCSSSLVALEMGCKSILNKECTMALVGAAYVGFSPQHYVLLSRLKVLSEKGRCQTFDERADGIVSGEGVGLLLLKSLDQALQDGDCIHTVIKGTFVNNDGRSSRFTATSPEAQEQMLMAAIKRSRVDPESISYIETHGTGTRLGDPIELMALHNAFKKLTNKKSFCGIGSVKSNIGHLEPACGVAGLIKVIMAMQHRMIPPTIHFKQMNHYFNVVDSPFFITDKLTSWDDRCPRRAGVSSFGMGGTNVHVVLEESPKKIRKRKKNPFPEHIFVLSAKSLYSLKRNIDRYIRYLTSNPQVSISSLCYTVNRNRGQFEYRIAVICSSVEDLAEKLHHVRHFDTESDYTGNDIFIKRHKCKKKVSSVIVELENDFLKNKPTVNAEFWKFFKHHFIADNGNIAEKDSEIAHYINELLEKDRYGTFLRFCARVYLSVTPVAFQKMYPKKFRQTIALPTYAFDRKEYLLHDESEERLHPLVYKEYARTYNQVIYCTNCNQHFCDLFEDHRIMQHRVLPASAMIEFAAVSGREFSAQPVTAIHNVLILSPLHITNDTIIHSRVEHEHTDTAIQFSLTSSSSSCSDKNSCQWHLHAQCSLTYETLPTEPVVPVQEFRASCQNAIAIDSLYEHFSVTGLHYGEHYKRINELMVGENAAYGFIQAGSGKKDQKYGWVCDPAILDAGIQIAVVFVMGAETQPCKPYLPFTVKRVLLYRPLDASCHCLLTKPQRKNGMLRADILFVNDAGEPLVAIEQLTLKQAALPLLPGHIPCADTSDWFSCPVWRKKDILSEAADPVPGRYCVFSNGDSYSAEIIDRMRKNGHTVLTVEKGNRFSAEHTMHYCLNPGSQEDMIAFVHHIHSAKHEVSHIVYLWSINGNQSEHNDTTDVSALCCFFHLIQSLMQSSLPHTIQLLLVTDHAQSVTGEESYVRPEDSSLWGFCRTVPKESPRINCCCMDISLKEINPGILGEYITEELNHGLTHSHIAFRDNERYVWSESPVADGDFADDIVLESQKVYLITGGFGGMAVTLARYLSEEIKARVILINRSPLSEKKSEIKEQLHRLHMAENPVEYYIGDVSDQHQMSHIVADVKKNYSRIDGIFHLAGVVKDGLIKNKTFEDFLDVIQPKINATRILHDIFKNEQLDFFISFSSIVSVYGNIGQADYAAANAFLDCFAAYQRKQGVPGLSINWSYFENGMGRTLRESAVRRGYYPISANEFIQCLEKAVRYKKQQLIVAHRNRDKILTVSSEQSVLKPAVSGPESAHQTLLGFCKDYLIKKIARLLAIAEDCLALEMDTDTSFLQCGMDSVLAVQFAEELRRDMDVDIDSTIVFDYPTIDLLSAYVCDHYPGKITALFNRAGEFVTDTLPQNCAYENRAHQCSDSVSSCMMQHLADILEVPVDAIDSHSRFMELGIDSVLAVTFTKRLETVVHASLDPTLVFDYPDIASLAEYIQSRYRSHIDKNESGQETLSPVTKNRTPVIAPVREKSHETFSRNSTFNSNDIAVIGMSSRFPDADTHEDFWSNIVNKKSSVCQFPDKRFRNLPESLIHPEFCHSRYSFPGGYLNDIDYFDPLFFEISPAEAEFMDPQQRLLLESVWQAVEHAGYTKKRMTATRTAVYIGACIIEYTKFINELDARAGTGTEMSILANRISYFLNLKGASVTCDTACSSSLVALHLGCQDIATGSSDMAIVGGVNLILTPWYSHVFRNAGMLSKNGQCSVFDQSADGYVRGEGCGVIILKSFEKALSDKDTICAVIKGTAINQDGRSNGLTAPNALAQEEVILQSWKRAGIDPRTISLVEAHGTGTSLGDPIEINGLTRAFRRFTNDCQFCAIGSVKTNIGHLEAAAGISGVIKVILALTHKTLPPTLNFNQKNPLIDFSSGPFFVNDRPHQWTVNGYPRRATVSSFGFGGTNAHVVIEEYCQPQTEKPADTKAHLMVLSAKTRPALEEKTRQLSQYVKSFMNTANVAYTLATKKDHFLHRLALITESIDDFKYVLEDLHCDEINRYQYAYAQELKKNQNTAIIFMFNQQQENVLRSGMSLYNEFPQFRYCIDLFQQHLCNHIPFSLKDCLGADSDKISRNENQTALDLVHFALRYSCAQLLFSWGIEPDLVCGQGHDMILAACVAGRLTPQESITIKVSSIGTSDDHEARYRNDFVNRSIQLNSPLMHLSSGTVANGTFRVKDGLEKELAAGQTCNLKNLNTLINANRAICLQIGIEDFALKNAIHNATMKQAVSVVPLLKKGVHERYSILAALAHLYVCGADIDWDSVYKNDNPVFLPLPTYPFQRKSYWFDNNKKHTSSVRLMAQEWNATIPCKSAVFSKKQTWIVFADQSGISDHLVHSLKEHDQEVISVRAGDAWEVIDKDHYRIDCKNEQNYRTLFNLIVNENRAAVDYIIFNWPLDHKTPLADHPESLDDRLHIGIFALFHISKVLAEMKPHKNLSLVTVSYCGHFIDTGIPVHVESSLIPIFSKTIPHEIKHVSSKHINYVHGQIRPGDMSRIILEESLETPYKDEITYSNGSRKNRNFIAVNGTDLPLNHLIHTNDTVIIFGGATGFGFEISRFLGSITDVHLVLVGRTPIPPQHEWDAILANEYTNQRVKEIVCNLKILHEEQCDVEYHNGDITDYKSVRCIVQSVKARRGAVACVIHGAGVIDSRSISIRSKTAASFQRTLYPKVHGTLVLSRIAQEENIANLILFSSLASLYGEMGKGFSDYAAANAFLNSMACCLKAGSTINCITIQWPVIADVGMSNRGLTTQKGVSITKQEALTVFKHIIEKQPGQQLSVFAAEQSSAKLHSVSTGVHKKSNPEMHVKPITDHAHGGAEKRDMRLQTITMCIKQSISTIVKIPVEDLDEEADFSEFGMDSIAIADLMGAIERDFHKHFDPSLILAHPSITALARFLRSELSQVQIFTEMESAAPAFSSEKVLSSQQKILNDLYAGNISLDNAFQQILNS